MKKIVKAVVAKKEYDLMFNILRLAKFEQMAGFSIFQVFLSFTKFSTSTVDLVLKGFASATDKTYEEAADILQEHLDNGGTIQEVATKVIEAIEACGILPKVDENAKKKTAEKAAK